MKNQALFSKDKSKILKCRLLQFLFGALWVKHWEIRKPSNFCLGHMENIGFRCLNT